jgi:hypothetical protein
MQFLYQRRGTWKLLPIESELKFTYRESDFVFFIQVLFVLRVAELSLLTQPYLGLALFGKGLVNLGHRKQILGRSLRRPNDILATCCIPITMRINVWMGQA